MLAGKLEPKLKMNINIVSIKSINSVWIPSIGGTKLIRKVGYFNLKLIMTFKIFKIQKNFIIQMTFKIEIEKRRNLKFYRSGSCSPFQVTNCNAGRVHGRSWDIRCSFICWSAIKAFSKPTNSTSGHNQKQKTCCGYTRRVRAREMSPPYGKWVRFYEEIHSRN